MKRKEKAEEAGRGCPSPEGYPGPMAQSSEEARKPWKVQALGAGEGCLKVLWDCSEHSCGAVSQCSLAASFPPALTSSPVLTLPHPKGTAGRAAGMQVPKGMEGVTAVVQWDPEGDHEEVLPEPGPFEEPFFPFETFLCPSEKALGNWLPPVQKARVRLELLTPKYRAGKRWLNPWLA